MPYSLEQDGFELVPAVLDRAMVGKLREVLSDLALVPGHRNLMKRFPAIASLASFPSLLGLIERRTNIRHFPVRSIFFNKTPEANWLVPWHQDLSIAVKRRVDFPDYGPWSSKVGVPHVQPPTAVLESMVTLRVHLDDCNESNGPLRVIPGSHLGGRLGGEAIVEARRHTREVTLAAKAGDVLIMRPLLLHASSEAKSLGHRRVIHLEYASSPLVSGLEWAEAPTKEVVTLSSSQKLRG